MMNRVYSVSSDRQAALKKVLEEDPYAEVSFARLGYTLKESSGLGLPAGKYVIHFKCDDAVFAKLKEKLAKVEGGVEEVTGADKEKIVAAINAEQDAATAGFGAIFG